jgi:hydroxymethylbilane synthase
MMDRTRIVIGTRKSRLALAQSEMVASAIRAAWPDLEVSLHPIITKGDINLDKPLPLLGGKGLFTLELEQALLSERIDLAVHSAKDLPTESPPGLDILCVPRRAAVCDVMVTSAGLALSHLPSGARVGTSSLRRQLQLAAVRPDLRFADIRGNIDTRVQKVVSGQYDAVVLAQAGLIRAGMTEVPYAVLSPEQVLPAPGQAALAVQGRAGDTWLRDHLSPIDDPVSAACLHAERRLLQSLRLDCHMPFAALCEPCPEGFSMQTWLADPGTGRALRVQARAPSVNALVAEILRRVEAGGGQELLDGCRHPR